MFSESFMNPPLLATSQGIVWDSRECMAQTRSHATTYGEELFTSLTGWIHSHTNVTIQPEVNLDPAINNSLTLESEGSLCFAQRVYPIVPAKFGFSFFPALIMPANSLGEALLIQLQKTSSNKNVMLRYFASGLFVFLSGQWVKLTSHFNTTYCEWWVEVSEEDSSDIISVYGGTEKVATVSGTLPSGPANNSGLLCISQGSITKTISKIAYFALGDTQLCDEFQLTTAPYTLSVDSTSVSVLLLIEDTSNELNPILDIAANILRGGITGASFNLPLRLLAPLCNGVLDSTKKINIFIGTIPLLAPRGTKLQLSLYLPNHKFIGLHGVNLCVTSTL